MIEHYLSNNNEMCYSNFSPYFSHTKRGLTLGCLDTGSHALHLLSRPPSLLSGLLELRGELLDLRRELTILRCVLEVPLFRPRMLPCRLLF